MPYMRNGLTKRESNTGCLILDQLTKILIQYFLRHLAKVSRRIFTKR